MLIFQQAGQGVGEGLGSVVAGFRIQRDVDLQSFRAGSLGKALKSETLENLTQPKRNLAALHDVGRWPWIKIENDHRWTGDLLCERERRMQFDRGEICKPHQRR